jgi:hypothetical protein
MTQSTKGLLYSPLTYVTPTTTVNYFYNNGDTMLIIKNASASPITVTFDSVELCNQGVDHDVVVTIANATEKVIGMFRPSRYNDSTGSVKMTISVITSVTFAVVEVLT